MNETQRSSALRLADSKPDFCYSSLCDWADEAAALLRELLAAEPVQEPVAWGVFVDDELFKPFNCKDEAVDWFQAQYNHGSRYDYLVLPLYAAPQQRVPVQGEPVAWMHFGKVFDTLEKAQHDEMRHRSGGFKPKPIIPLFAAPQQPMRCPEDGGACGAGGYCRPQLRKPLTDEAIEAILDEFDVDREAWKPLARAIERAHGITGEPT